MIYRLWYHIPKHRKRQVILLLCLMIIASLAEFLSIGLVVPFLSVLTDPSQLYEIEFFKSILLYLNINDPKKLLLPITIIFAIAAMFAGLIRVLLMIVQTRVGYLTGAELGVQIYNKTLNQPYQVHLQNNSSEIIAGISHKTTALVQQGIIAVLTLISYSLIFIAIMTVLLVVNFKVAIVSFGIFGGIYFIMIVSTKPIVEEKGRVVTRMQGSVIKNIQEGLGAIRDILLDRSQPVYVRAFEKSEFGLRHAQIIHIILSTTPKFILEALGIALIAILAYFLLSEGNTALGIFPILGVLALGAQRMLPILQQIYATWSSFRAGRAAFNDALNLLDQPIKQLEFFDESFEYKSKLKLDKVSFCYDLDDTVILDEVDLEIDFGSRIGIIGSTGSGKSTILDIIMGLLRPTNGKLLVDDTIIDDNNTHLWQRMVAHVPQTIFLSDASIAENVAFGVDPKHIDFTKVDEVIELAQLSSTVRNLKKGYDSHVGEKGIRLSGGERQRIGIARALYKGATTIIFDEATSALDSATEEEVMKSILKLPADITMIIVAHRTSTLAQCDHIYKIKNSKLHHISTL